MVIYVRQAKGKIIYYAQHPYWSQVSVSHISIHQVEQGVIGLFKVKYVCHLGFLYGEVQGFVTDCACDVWWRWLTTRLIYMQNLNISCYSNNLFFICLIINFKVIGVISSLHALSMAIFSNIYLMKISCRLFAKTLSWWCVIVLMGHG